FVVQAPDAGGHFDAGLVSLRRLSRGGTFDLDAVALLDAADLGVHEARYPVLAGEDAEMRAHGSAGADDTLELFEDGGGERPATVIDYADGFGRHAAAEQLEHALARADVTGNADEVFGVFDHIVADAALLAAILVRRQNGRLGMFEAEILQVL